MPKEVLHEVIAEENEAWAMLAEVRDMYHPDTSDARIALAWKRGTKLDPDGHLILGTCHKVTDLMREVAGYDFVITLNQEAWTEDSFTREKKVALLDHEMCHAARAVDNEGEWQEDTKGRPVWRIKNHDIEEFHAIIQRHGCWKVDLENFAQKILEKKNLLALTEPRATVIRGETILIPPMASMGTEMIDPFPDGKVY